MNYELNESFHITNDNTADWALQAIKEERKERDRIIAIAENQIAELEQQIEELKTKCDNKTSFLKNCLAEYVMKVPRKETKTQEKYSLLTGDLIIKKASVKINHDDDKLIEFLKDTDYVERVPKLRWGEYKKCLTICGKEVINSETGEVIPGCAIEEVPAEFDIKLKEDK